jgi:hypothetical protein
MLWAALSHPAATVHGMTTAAEPGSSGTDWPCVAYGPEGLAAGARCFRSAEPGERVCSSRAECEDVMTAERQRVFRRINELAATGDPDFEALDAAFPSPADLLNAGDDTDPPTKDERA